MLFIKRFVTVLAFSLVLLLVLTSCGGGGAMKGLDESDLSSRHAECLDRPPTAPGRATACENVRKECERRRKDLGRYICRTQ